MARHDVSAAFAPEFYTPVNIKRYGAELDGEGVWRNTGYTLIAQQAVVIPMNTTTTHQLQNTAAVDGITVYCRFALRPAMAGTRADCVIYNGHEYRVDSVGNYGAYGKGFWSALCLLSREDADSDDRVVPDMEPGITPHHL